MTLLDLLENDLAYRALYSRYLAWKHKQVPFKLRKALTFNSRISIEQERTRYLREISQGQVKKTVQALQRAAATKVQDGQTQTEKIKNRDHGRPGTNGTENNLHGTRLRSGTQRHPEKEVWKLGERLVKSSSQD